MIFLASVKATGLKTENESLSMRALKLQFLQKLKHCNAIALESRYDMFSKLLLQKISVIVIITIEN